MYAENVGDTILSLKNAFVISILLAGMMLAQMTAFAAPEAEVAETAQETVSEVQTGAELNAEDYGYPFPNFSLDMSSRPEGVANEIKAGKVSDSLTTFGTLVVKDENANDGYPAYIDAIQNIILVRLNIMNKKYAEPEFKIEIFVSDEDILNASGERDVIIDAEDLF